MTPEAEAVYTCTLPYDDTDQRQHVFPGLAGRKKISEITLKDIETILSKGKGSCFVKKEVSPAAPKTDAKPEKK